MNELQGKRILVGITGSIAAYKACDLVRLLRKEGADVTVAMTRSATNFVGAATFAAFSTHPVMVEQFPKAPSAGVPHVDIAEEFDAIVVAPASANILGKTAHAIADNMLSTLLNIAECPVLFVPAMNYRMWRNPATQDAVERLRKWGRTVMEPAEGMLASMHVGLGRLPEIDSILHEIRGLLGTTQLYREKKIVITAGPTRESVDPVRFISNRSSGRMGYALAAAARDMGAEVTLISGPVNLAPVPGCRIIHVTTANELLAALEDEAEGQDMLLMAAAVADFRPSSTSVIKLRRDSGMTSLELEAVPDILQELKGKFKGLTVAFALERSGELDYAREKGIAKGVDYVVVNAYDEAGAGMESMANHVWIVPVRGATVEIPLAPKETIARKILEVLAKDIPLHPQGSRDNT
ncbi:bifunctional phosphopantothenoylcysteine decarboxylase/phosphopantothenate--cysteine ligase CoaBC [Candidatus Neomarinimicrobiota bacterium]